MKFKIEYSPDAEDHLRMLSRRDQATVLDQVDVQLTREPDVETRNRKAMKPNPVAPWELRIGNVRVYYDIEYKPGRHVFIRALGIKKRNVVVIGGKEIAL